MWCDIGQEQGLPVAGVQSVMMPICRITNCMSEALDSLVSALTQQERDYRQRNGWLWYGDHRHTWSWQAGPKWIKINRDGGGCGAFLCHRETGELYNIQGYGRPDHNKKLKADIGNLFTADAKVLFTKQNNYLNHFAASDSTARTYR